MNSTPFLIDKNLLKNINVELILVAGLIKPIHKDVDEEEQEYCLTLEGVNYSWFTLKVIRDYLVQNSELDNSN